MLLPRETPPEHTGLVARSRPGRITEFAPHCDAVRPNPLDSSIGRHPGVAMVGQGAETVSEEAGRSEPSGSQRRPGTPIRVDSLREAHAYLDAYPHASGAWALVAETRSSRAGGSTLTVTVAAPDGDRLDIAFDVSGFTAAGGGQRFGVEPTIALDELLAGVAEFAAANPPHHPGTLPRFPIPSRRYPGRAEVPLAILAADDDGRPGLYAPAKLVVVSLEDGKPYGIGDVSGFDPDRWPPERLGDWPPKGTIELPRRQLAGRVGRFNGVWLRIISAVVGVATYPFDPKDKREAQILLASLDVQGMARIYRDVNPSFWDELLRD